MQLSMDKRFSTRTTNEICKRIALSLCSEISDATARESLVTAVTCDDFPYLCDFAVSYALSTADVIAVRQVLALYQKRKDLDLTPRDQRGPGHTAKKAKQSVAWNSFQANEVRCALTNDRFKHYGRREQIPAALDGLLYEAQRKISRVLGPVPDIRDLSCRFGPGATTGCQKRTASWKNKFSEPLACSEELASDYLLGAYLAEVPEWCAVHNTAHPDGENYLVPVRIVPGNLVFVPKNAKTYRSVVVEPVLNSFYQLGVGDYIGRRLKRVGIDVTDQTANQRAALIGSITGELATLDLSFASDTIARELVYHLLPIDWAIALDHLCTHTVVYEGAEFKLQKFSSMGNGFTFPLETLIFWALASAASESDPRVLAYGDDLVVPTQFYSITFALLAFCGFEVNLKKSYASGPFRESCGKDYLSGIDVRPVYVKDRVNYLDLFRLHNAFMRRLDIVTASLILHQIPESIRLWGPDGYGDGHLITSHLFPHLRPHGRERGWSGFIFDTYVAKPRRDFRRLPGDRVLPTYSVYVGSELSSDVGPDEDWGPDWSDYLETLSRGFTPHKKAKGAARQKDNQWDYEVPSGTLPGDRGYKRVSIYTLIPLNL